MQKISVSIIGGSGYAGGELIRILLLHPNVTLLEVSSERFAGQPVSFVHPNLRGRTDLVFTNAADFKKCDLLIVALPNKVSMTKIPDFIKISKKIIDLGADFRLTSQILFEKWYETKHLEPKLLKEFVYGIAELKRNEIKKAKYVACGGCEATAIILALYPVVKMGLIEKDMIIADVKIGSSAAGGKPTSSSHHPERHNVLRSYKPTHHRHEAEISENLGVRVEISATAVNLVRGILATIHTRVKKSTTEKDIWMAYRKVYKDEPFIRIVKQKSGLYRFPEPKLLWGTNYCDIGFEIDNVTNRLVIIAAIDNLVKGTAGQAVQAMNIMYGFPETTALEFPGLHPI